MSDRPPGSALEAASPAGFPRGPCGETRVGLGLPVWLAVGDVPQAGSRRSLGDSGWNPSRLLQPGLVRTHPPRRPSVWGHVTPVSASVHTWPSPCVPALHMLCFP